MATSLRTKRKSNHRTVSKLKLLKFQGILNLWTALEGKQVISEIWYLWRHWWRNGWSRGDWLSTTSPTTNTNPHSSTVGNSPSLPWRYTNSTLTNSTISSSKTFSRELAKQRSIWSTYWTVQLLAGCFCRRRRKKMRLIFWRRWTSTRTRNRRSLWLKLRRIRSDSTRLTKLWAKCVPSCLLSSTSPKLRSCMSTARNSSKYTSPMSKITTGSSSTQLHCSSTGFISTKSKISKAQSKHLNNAYKFVKNTLSIHV